MDLASLVGDMWLNNLTALALLKDLETAAMTAPLTLSAMMDHVWLE